MLDYTVNKKDKEKFILNYEIVDDNLLVTFANGKKWAVKKTPENEKQILLKMKEQVLSVSKKRIKKMEEKISRNLYISFLCACTGIAIIVMNYPLDSFFLNLIPSLTIIGFNTPINFNYKRINILHDIARQKFMINESDKLNKGISNPNLLLGLDKKSQKLIKNRIAAGQEVFNLNTVNKFYIEDLRAMKQKLINDEYYKSICLDKVKQKTK